MYEIDRLTVEEYLEKLASPTFPGPASGSAAATAAAMAAALFEMSIKVTINRDEQKNHLAKILQNTEMIRKNCLSLATKDMEAYAEVVRALKAKEEFPADYEAAMKSATDTLVSIVKNCDLMITEIEHAVNDCYAKVVGDLGGSVYLAEAAAAAAKLGVEINLRLLSDESYKSDVRNSVRRIYRNCSEIKDRIVGSRFYAVDKQ